MPPEDDGPFDGDVFDKKIFEVGSEEGGGGEDDYSVPIGRGLWDDYGLRASIARFRAGRRHRF